MSQHMKIPGLPIQPLTHIASELSTMPGIRVTPMRAAQPHYVPILLARRAPRLENSAARAALRYQRRRVVPGRRLVMRDGLLSLQEQAAVAMVLSITRSINMASGTATGRGPLR